MSIVGYFIMKYLMTFNLSLSKDKELLLILPETKKVTPSDYSTNKNHMDLFSETIGRIVV